MSDKDISNKDDNKFSFIEIMINKAFELGSSAAGYLYPKLLRLLGARPINSDSNSNLSMYNSIVSNEEPNVITKSIATFLEMINGVIGNSLVNESLEQATQNTKNKISNLIEIINAKLNDPAFKFRFKLFLKNISEYCVIVLRAMDNPIDDAIDKLSETSLKLAKEMVASGAKVTTSALAAIPGIGVIFDLIRMMTDISEGATSIVDAGSSFTTTFSKIITETSKNVDKELSKNIPLMQGGAKKMLMKNKREKINTEKRIFNSISDFFNPMKSIKNIKKRQSRKTKKNYKKL